MIDKELAWQHIFSNAKKALATNMIFHSLKENKPYKVISVFEDSIVLLRLKEQTPEALTKSKIIRAIDKINAENCKPFRRATLIDAPVILETTLVLFCPYLTWDETTDYIISINLQ